MALFTWEWELEDMTMSDEEYRAYHTMKGKEWKAKHPEEAKSSNIVSVRKYQARKREEDLEGFKKYHNEISKKCAKKRYQKMRAAMTEEELEEYRRVTRERVRAIRARKKMEAEMLKEKEKGQE